jgi:hypothetical protein
MKLSKYILPFVIFALPVITHAQAGIKPKANDVTAPLHALKPDYKIPYGAPAVSNVTEVLNRIYNYLNIVQQMFMRPMVMVRCCWQDQRLLIYLKIIR